MTYQVATANRLDDGAVVFLAHDAGWTESLDEVWLAGDAAEAAVILDCAERAAATRKVVGPYLIEVVLDGGHARPATLREAIRANGPTVWPAALAAAAE